VPNPAFRFTHAAAHARDRVPDLGEDATDLLREIGCTDGDIAALRASGAVHVPSDGAGGHDNKGDRQ
jgi:CoA:oxalate CoA-transferase